MDDIGNVWPRLRDLPEKERKEFTQWLRGQTVPLLQDVPATEQDAYYPWDYQKWKIIKAGGSAIWD